MNFFTTDIPYFGYFFASQHVCLPKSYISLFMQFFVETHNFHEFQDICLENQRNLLVWGWRYCWLLKGCNISIVILNFRTFQSSPLSLFSSSIREAADSWSQLHLYRSSSISDFQSFSSYYLKGGISTSSQYRILLWW